MYSPDGFSPPPMEDMSPTTGMNSNFRLFEDRVGPFWLFFSNRLCTSDYIIRSFTRGLCPKSVRQMSLFDTDV